MKIGRPVWYCKKKLQSEIGDDGQEYCEPVRIDTRFNYFTVMEKKGTWNIAEMGISNSSDLTAIAQPYEFWEDKFTNGTLFYCNGAEPSTSESYYGQNANYQVDDIGYGNIKISLNLKKVRE